jgi:lipopolysaccharide/colanic/teichoic acid biosynthesis glycosyltransferase
VARYQPWHFDRLEVRPGLTGLWQVRDRGEFSFDECVRLDLLYIDNRSLAFDLRILAQSVPALLRRRGRC